MKNLFISALVLVLSLPGFAGTYPVTVAKPSDARGIIQQIMDVVGLEPTFEIKAANIPNAAAVISSGKRFILYNPSFINSISQASGDKWASIAILAHEIGHHLNGHTLLGSGSTPALELEADQFSGFALRKMGASLSQAQSAMKIIASERASKTHPARTDRLLSIENGWNKAESQLTGKDYIAKDIPQRSQSVQQRVGTSVQPRTTSYRLDPRYVAYNAVFFSDRNNPYHITTNNNLVTVRGSNLIILGKMLPTRNSSYPFLLQVNGKNELFISNRGYIITPTQKQVGYIKSA